MTTQDGQTLCELEHVVQEFPQPRGGLQRVLDDVSLTVHANEVIALLGPSGCGKSTLLRILAGLTRPTRGSVLYHGEPLLGLNPGVAFVFQSFALFPWMTVTENVEAALRPLGLLPGEISARAAKAIALVGLSGSGDAYPRELSGGMKQRVGMARALSLDPEMLFMDEPFSQVDALTAESLRAEVLDIWAAKDRNPSAVVLVSHDIKEVVSMADRIVVLGSKPGRVRTVVENTLARPRNYRSPSSQLVDRLHDIITGAEMPDVVAPAGEAASRSSAAAARVGEIVGLLSTWTGGREESSASRATRTASTAR
jgi:NitT/TauT family transport system ATP-binding protein